MKDMKKDSGFSKSVFMTFMSVMVSSVLVFTQQKPPVFRSQIDLRQLDVTVLDRNRRPVKGLAQEDFTVTEDGVPQRIDAFSFVDLGDTVVKDEPKWAASAASDVVTNNIDSARVFVLVVDDVHGMGDLWGKNQLPRSVRTFVEQLGTEDVAALVFTGHGDLSVNFTRDKAKLIKSLDWYLKANETAGPCDATPYALRYVTENLAQMKNRRRAVVIFTGSLGFDPSPNNPCGGWLWDQTVQIAKENNITFYPVDTMGMRPWRPGDVRGTSNGQIVDNWISLAHYTGGRALINSNSFTDGLTKIYEENASYYLLAYQPTKVEEDGRFRRVVVNVNRPDVEVTSTRSYWATEAATPKKPAPLPPSPQIAALAGVLPVAQIPLRASVVPFKGDGSAAAVLAISLGLTQPAFTERTHDDVHLTIRVLTLDGADYGGQEEVIKITVPETPFGADTTNYELLARVDIPKPGRYDVRMSAHSEATDRRASVYVDLDVPDFGKEKMSLSGVVISAMPGHPAAPFRALDEITPFSPTTERAFGDADIVTAFLRVYQCGTGTVVSVPLEVRIQDAAGKTLFDRTDTLPAEKFGANRAAEYQFRVPFNTLSAGEYLLSFEASAGKTIARRDVRLRKR